jgi:hypothetical protein
MLSIGGIGIARYARNYMFRLLLLPTVVLGTSLAVLVTLVLVVNCDWGADITR